MPRARLKVLIVARHPSAGGGTIVLAAEARRRGVGVEIFATGHALVHLSANRVRGVVSFATARRRYPQLPVYRGVERIETADVSRDCVAARVEQMAVWLTQYVAASRVDAVLATDATEQLGADQLIAVAATRAGVPCVRVRDAWGIGVGIETRAWHGRLPALVRREALATRYLEIDQAGVNLSVERLGLPRARLSALNGLYTLDRFAGRANAARRSRARRRLGVGAREPLVLLFSQPTRRETAEVDCVEAIAAGFAREGLSRRGVIVAALEHPREADPADGRLGLGWTAACVSAGYPGRVIDLSPIVGRPQGLSFEDAMTASDVVASSYSNASIEATALGATAAGLAAGSRPIGMHVLASASVQAVFRKSRAGLRRVPMVDTGALPCALSRREIGPLVSRLLFQPSGRQPYFTEMRRRWNAGAASARVIDEVIAAVSAQ